jgi:hypothetical protein
MQLDEYLNLLESQGVAAIETENCSWQQIGPRGFITAPGCFPVSVRGSDIRMMFLRGALFLRVIEPESQIQSEHERWHRYVAEPPYDLDHLGKKARNQTRRGCENCEVRRVSFEQIVEEGVQANIDTHQRHGLSDETSDDAVAEWKSKTREYARWPDVRAYAAFVSGLDHEMAAFLISILVGTSWFISVHRSTNEGLSHYPNNALIFEATKDLLNDWQGELVINGIESLEENEGLRRFKTGLGFQLEPVRHRLLFHPLVQPLLNQSAKSLVIKMSRQLEKMHLISSRLQKRISAFYDLHLP